MTGAVQPVPENDDVERRRQRFRRAQFQFIAGTTGHSHEGMLAKLRREAAGTLRGIDNAVPAMVASPQSFSDLVVHNPHCRAVCTA